MLEDILTRTTDMLSGFVPSLLGAIGILVIGWIVAVTVRSVVRGTLRRTRFDERVAEWTTGKPVSIAHTVGTVAYWIIMLFVAMAVFQTLDLPLVAEPLNALLSQLANFVPQLAGAIILLLVAWIIATVGRRVVSGVLRSIKLDERLAGDGDAEPPASLAASLGEAVYWLVFLLFLPAVLGALALEGLLEPVQSLVDDLLGFLPNVLGAGLILAVGWFVANLLSRIVTNLLASVGADGIADRLGLGQALGTMRLSGLVGLIVYVLVLIPVLISALDSLALEAVTAPASEMLASILNAVPILFGAAVLLAIAYFIGRVVADLLTNVLVGAGFDTILTKLGLARDPAEGRRPSDVAGLLVLVALMLFASIEAAGMLGFESLSDLISRFLVMGGQVVLGLVIFGIGLFLANVAENAVRASSTPQSGLLAITTRAAIIVLAGAMGLRQMGLANEIITLAFGLLLGAIAVASALAFGLGARDVAGRSVENWVNRIKGS